MSLNIKNAETESLVRELAATTGETVTRAVTEAVRERLDRVRAHDPADAARRRALLEDIASGAAGRWIEPFKSADHGDLLYDELGRPR